ncbi:Diverse 7TM receptor transmembrane region [Pseudopedobacter saltans DSM 12145]|uniref:Diverse 7TM receptor transmembrane region n=1 Tax=Pseudopedobacter saltans (strain ATCC 51119 / DSM 12145 / JCM 21818 / CCUG 39354 / LMG 10337 / NBRC 100064 / NCIMB 13643) TaxID=762903 RepID=F0SA45_PSESL|nr:7TM diverse intracellular signaling domain-containing protein [Pseudopedobacter saltans]ADY53609.1 Diverse 7TM receptor transmembrane region [Pseudopedobacter saltans DSM 12145]
MFQNKRAIFALFVFVSVLFSRAFAQQDFKVNSGFEEHVFVKDELFIYEDKTGKLGINDILSETGDTLFKANRDHYPRNRNKESYYWVRVNINVLKNLNGKYVFEFYDQTTEFIEAYIPNEKGNYVKRVAGAQRPFNERLLGHKNYHFNLLNLKSGEQTCYFRVKSSAYINIIIVLRSIERVLNYAISEYFMFGLFYGMLLIFCLHNMLMYIAIKRKEYLIYVVYLVFVALFEMSSDGVAFQFIWPNLPSLNPYATGISLYCMGISALVFMLHLLHVKVKAPGFYKLTIFVIAFRTIFFLICLFIKPEWFIYKFIEFIPLSLCFIIGINILVKGYKPARFFVLAYSILMAGFAVRVLMVLGIARFLPGYVTYYSLSVCFILEMVFLSFSIGDQVRILKKRKVRAQDKVIQQMKINTSLKDKVNRELEEKVADRTLLLKEQKEELLKHKAIIEAQNETLLAVNQQLEAQKEEIANMNALLEKDNEVLKINIEEVTDARIHSRDIGFNEFVVKYPDKESCYKFLSEIKWRDKEYLCKRCDNDAFYPGKSPFGRRCSKCNYDESVLSGTIFQNSRIPINKAFYILLLIHKNKGEISSYQLSKKTGIRQSTCWQYASNYKDIIAQRNAVLKKTEQSDWMAYVLVE